MENKKVYDNPELSVICLKGADVIMLSADPASGDLTWADTQGNGGEQV